MSDLTFSLPDEVLEQLAQRVATILEQRINRESPPLDRWLTVAEAADYARCDAQRIYDLRSSGRLSRHSDGTRALINRDELDHHLRGGV